MSKIFKAQSGEVVEINPIDRKTFSLEELQNIVGGPIEILTLSDSYLVCHEEGKLNNFPTNAIATHIVRLEGIDDYIVGDVLICSKDLIE